MSTSRRSLAVHRCRFVDWQPSAIQCIASFSFPSSNSTSTFPLTRIAVSRENNDIELWRCSLVGNWSLEFVLPGRHGSDTRALCFNKSGTLFSVGLPGQLVQWNLDSGEPQHVLDVGGGACWSMACDPRRGNRIAIGCEDGIIRIFSVADSSFDDDDNHSISDREDYRSTFLVGKDDPPLMIRSLHKHNHRVTAVAWHPSDGKTLITGGADGWLRRFNAQTGECIWSTSLGRIRSSRPTVWSISVLSDLTVISGDSSGRTRFWDGISGTLQKSFDDHEAEVLSVAVSKDETSVYSSGIDNKIVCYRRLGGNHEDSSQLDKNTVSHRTIDFCGPRDWVFGGKRRPHTHDITSLCVISSPDERTEWLLSGSVDTQMHLLPIHTFTSARAVKIPPFRIGSREKCSSSVIISRRCHRILVRYEDRIEIFEISSLSDVSIRNGSDSNLHSSVSNINSSSDANEPRLLLQLLSKSQYNITCAALSDCGQFVSFSCRDGNGTRFYQLVTSEDTTSTVSGSLEVIALHRVPIRQTCDSVSDTLDLVDIRAHVMSFSLNSSVLCIVRNDRTLVVVRISGEQHKTFDQGTSNSTSTMKVVDSLDIGVVRLPGLAPGEDLSDTDSGLCYPGGFRCHLLSVSDDAQYAVLSDVHPFISCPVHIVSIDAMQVLYSISVSEIGVHMSSGELVSAIRCSGHLNSPRFAAVSSSNQIALYRLDSSGEPMEWTQKCSHRLPIEYLSQPFKVQALAFDPHFPDILYGNSSSYFVAIDTSQDTMPEHLQTGKKRQSAPSPSPSDSTELLVPSAISVSENQTSELKIFGTPSFRFVRRYQPLLAWECLHIEVEASCSSLSSTEAVAIERPWVHIMESLPNVLDRRRFKS